MKKKANNHILQIVLLFLVLVGLLGILVQKYAPFLFHSTIFYCQEIIKSFTNHSLPQNSNVVFLVPVIFVLTLVGVRFTMTIVQLIIVARNLTQQKITQHSSRLDKLIQKLGLLSRVHIIKNKQPLALCYGLLKPEIYISTGLLSITSTRELEVILKHEKHHLMHNDNRSILFAHIVQSTFPLIPILSNLVNNFRIEREIAADEYASEGGNHQVVSAVLKKLLRNPQPAFAYFPTLAAEDTLQARIESLFLKKQFISQYSLKNSALSLFSILVLLGLIVAPVHAIEFHENGQDAIMVCANNEQCVTQCKANIQEMQRMSPALNKSIPYSPASVL